VVELIPLHHGSPNRNGPPTVPRGPAHAFPYSATVPPCSSTVPLFSDGPPVPRQSPFSGGSPFTPADPCYPTVSLHRRYRFAPDGSPSSQAVSHVPDGPPFSDCSAFPHDFPCCSAASLPRRSPFSVTIPSAPLQSSLADGSPVRHLTPNGLQCSFSSRYSPTDPSFTPRFLLFPDSIPSRRFHPVPHVVQTCSTTVPLVARWLPHSTLLSDHTLSIC
jgi:hypothetical protein